MCDPPAAATPCANITKAYDFAQEAAKQVLTLATGSLGGAIALLDDGDVPGVNFGAAQTTVMWGLGFLVASIVCGLLMLLNLTGTLEKPPTGGLSLYKPSIRLFWAGQLLLFAVGLGVLVSAV